MSAILLRLLMRRPIITGAVALAGAGAYALLARMLSPHLPDVALQAGMDLVSRRWKVLALGAHPDDLEFFLGGTLCLLARNESDVTAAVMSRGERSGRLWSMAAIRTREQEAAAEALGVRLRQFSLPDGALEEGGALFSTLETLWRETRPDLVFAPDPRGILTPLHNPDHRALGYAAIDLARRSIAGDARMYLYGGRQPNVLVDITEVIHEKESALRCHRSQLKGPDGVVSRIVRGFGRLGRSRTPAMYTESLLRLV